MKPPRRIRKSTVAAGAGATIFAMTLFVVSPHGASARVTTAPTKQGASARVTTAVQNWLGCSRPLVPPRKLPASLKGWYSSRNKYITRRIGLDQRALAREGVELTMWGPDSCSGRVRVYLTHYSRAAARTLITRYGNDVIVSRHSLPRPRPENRSNDTSPFAGGDFIVFPGASSQCSGGPIVQQISDGHPLMLSAGHCDTTLGDSVFRSDRSGNIGPIMGVIQHSRLCNNCIDSLTVRVDSTGANYVYEVYGDDSSGIVYFEDGTAFPQPFNLVTQDSEVISAK